MTRQPHDQFAKQYLEELLAPLGEVEVSREVTGEVRQVDVWFAPSPTSTADRQILGLLGRMGSSPCLLEPFRNQPEHYRDSQLYTEIVFPVQPVTATSSA